MKKQYIILLLILSCFYAQAKNGIILNEHNPSETGLLTIIPTFNPVGPICFLQPMSPLPSTSLNGITGSWSPAINNVVTTLYTFTPNVGQDAASVTLVILVSPSPAAPSLIATEPTCTSQYGAVTIVSAAPGTLYSFDGAGYTSTLVYTGLAAGSSHTVVAQNTTGCTSPTSSITLTGIAQPNAGVLSGNQNVCTGLTTVFSSTVNGGIWSTSNPNVATVNPITGIVTGISAGSALILYTVSEVFCGNAIATRSMTVNPISTTQMFCDPSQTISQNSVYFDWTNVPGFTSYQYTYSINGGQNISGSDSVSHYEVFGVLPGQSVTFTIANVVGVSCFTPVSLTCGVPLANNVFEEDAFVYYPNPVNDFLNLQSLQGITRIRIFDVLGQETISMKSSAGNVQIDMSRLKSGIYFVKMSSDQSVKTFKVIKN